MKTQFLVVLCIFFSLSLMAGTTGNVRTTAVSHDGFTIRWDEVIGADGYQIEVKKGVYGNVFETDFEGLETMPDGWTSSGNAGIHNYQAGALSGSYIAFLSKKGAYLQSPKYLNPIEFSFWAKVANIGASSSVKYGIIDSSDEWIDSCTMAAIPQNQGELNQAYNKFTYSPNRLGEYRLKLLAHEWSHTVFFDDFSVEAISPDSSIAFSASSTTAHGIRIPSALPQTPYIYRVKPNIADGEFSDWQVVNTPEKDASSNSGSAIAGDPASINLAVNNAVHKLDISPSSGVDADYHASVTQALASYSYRIQCDDSSALNAVYTILHPGLTAGEVMINAGELISYSCEIGLSTLHVGGIDARGELIIALNSMETLPVMLSSFSASIFNAKACRIDWTSQSESNILGYRILRGHDDQLAEAMSISTLIAGQNSSNTQHYSYRDLHAEFPAYYWLVVVNMDGSEDVHGPARVDLPIITNPVEPDYLNEFVVFPNPMGHDATLQISTKANQEAELRLYNLKGQLLRKDALGTLSKGKHCLPFICQDKDGVNLSSGVYLLELRYADSLLRCKIVVKE